MLNSKTYLAPVTALILSVYTSTAYSSELVLKCDGKAASADFTPQDHSLFVVLDLQTNKIKSYDSLVKLFSDMGAKDGAGVAYSNKLVITKTHFELKEKSTNQSENSASTSSMTVNRYDGQASGSIFVQNHNKPPYLFWSFKGRCQKQESQLF